MCLCTVRSGIFVKLSLKQFSQLFRLNHPDVRRNKEQRWATYTRATESGTLFARPPYVSSWRAEFAYHAPIPDVLQSSSDDVKLEVNVMRRAYSNSAIMFCGGDGLSLMRLNHLLCSEPETYLDSTPAVLPVQGEAPHGTSLV